MNNNNNNNISSLLVEAINKLALSISPVYLSALSSTNNFYSSSTHSNDELAKRLMELVNAAVEQLTDGNNNHNNNNNNNNNNHNQMNNGMNSMRNKSILFNNSIIFNADDSANTSLSLSVRKRSISVATSKPATTNTITPVGHPLSSVTAASSIVKSQKLNGMLAHLSAPSQPLPQQQQQIKKQQQHQPLKSSLVKTTISSSNNNSNNANNKLLNRWMVLVGWHLIFYESEDKTDALPLLVVDLSHAAFTLDTVERVHNIKPNNNSNVNSNINNNGITPTAKEEKRGRMSSFGGLFSRNSISKEASNAANNNTNNNNNSTPFSMATNRELIIAFHTAPFNRIVWFQLESKENFLSWGKLLTEQLSTAKLLLATSLSMKNDLLHRQGYLVMVCPEKDRDKINNNTSIYGGDIRWCFACEGVFGYFYQPTNNATSNSTTSSIQDANLSMNVNSSIANNNNSNSLKSKTVDMGRVELNQLTTTVDGFPGFSVGISVGNMESGAPSSASSSHSTTPSKPSTISHGSSNRQIYRFRAQSDEEAKDWVRTLKGIQQLALKQQTQCPYYWQGYVLHPRIQKSSSSSSTQLTEYWCIIKDGSLSIFSSIASTFPDIQYSLSGAKINLNVKKSSSHSSSSSSVTLFPLELIIDRSSAALAAAHSGPMTQSVVISFTSRFDIDNATKSLRNAIVDANDKQLPLFSGEKVREGFLYKEKPKNAHFRRLRESKFYWFVLDHQFLAYYLQAPANSSDHSNVNSNHDSKSTATPSASTSAPPKRVFELTKITSLIATPEGAGTFEFDIITPEKSLRLRAASAADHQGWCSDIARMMQEAKEEEAARLQQQLILRGIHLQQFQQQSNFHFFSGLDNNNFGMNGMNTSTDDIINAYFEDHNNNIEDDIDWNALGDTSGGNAEDLSAEKSLLKMLSVKSLNNHAQANNNPTGNQRSKSASNSAHGGKKNKKNKKKNNARAPRRYDSEPLILAEVQKALLEHENKNGSNNDNNNQLDKQQQQQQDAALATGKNVPSTMPHQLATTTDDLEDNTKTLAEFAKIEKSTMIVIDNGSAFLRFGPGGDKAPLYVVPSLAAVAKNSLYGSQHKSKKSKAQDHPGYYHPEVVAIGYKAIQVVNACPDYFELRNPFIQLVAGVESQIRYNGNGIDIALLCEIYKCAFNDIGLKPEDHPLLLSTPFGCSLAQQQELTTAVDSILQSPAIRMIHPALLLVRAITETLMSDSENHKHHHDSQAIDPATEAADDFTGLAVLWGMKLNIVPIIHGHIFEHGVIQLPFGGGEIDKHIHAWLVNKKGIYLPESQENAEMKAMKSRHFYVAMDYAKEEALYRDFSVTAATSSVLKEKTTAATATTATSVNDDSKRVAPSFHKLSNGTMVELGEERFRIPELLFTPHLQGGTNDHSGVAALVAKSLLSCPVDVRRQLYQNICISGGTTCFPNFKERLQKEVTKILTDSNTKNVNVVVTSTASKKYDVFLGGSVSCFDYL